MLVVLGLRVFFSCEVRINTQKELKNFIGIQMARHAVSVYIKYTHFL